MDADDRLPYTRVLVLQRDAVDLRSIRARSVPLLPLSGRVGRSACEWRGADETFSHPPFVLEPQYALKLRKPVRAALQRAQDRLPGDCQRHDVQFVFRGVLECFGSVVKAFYSEALREFKYEAVRDRETGEKHWLDDDRSEQAA
jgi:hypothetical protein